MRAADGSGDTLGLQEKAPSRGMRHLVKNITNNFHFVVYPSKCHVIIILCDVGGGAPLAWYESRGTGRCFLSHIVLPESGSPPPQAD